MDDNLRQELSGWGEVIWGEKVYRNIRYEIIIEKESVEDDEPDIYGTVYDEEGDKLDIPQFIGSPEDIILNLNDGRFLKMVFLDESPEFEVFGGLKRR